VAFSGIVEDPFRGCGLTRVDMGHNADITHHFKHGKSPGAFKTKTFLLF
jgi:hypothetical protein